jgi:hypothetical protein
MRAHDGDMFDDEEESMPPFNSNRTIWHGVQRRVIKRADPALPLTSKRAPRETFSVVVTFTRVGYSNETQQRITEELPEHVVATKLGSKQAEDMWLAISALCDDTYAQGYSDGRKSAR